jgi:DNA-binding transcriptional MocR family regulator
MPTMHNPLGATMPASRRAQIAGLATRFDMTIIEDDAYAFLDGAAPAPLQSLVPERTLRVLSLSKILSLTLRLGALVHPPPLRPLVTTQLRSLGLIANPVMASAAAELAAAGAMEALVARKRQEGAERQALARSILGAAFKACDAAWYGMLHVPGAGSGFAAQARRAGLAVAPAADFRPDSDDRRQVRVSLGSEASRARLAEGLSRLATLMR